MQRTSDCIGAHPGWLGKAVDSLRRVEQVSVGSQSSRFQSFNNRTDKIVDREQCAPAIVKLFVQTMLVAQVAVLGNRTEWWFHGNKWDMTLHSGVKTKQSVLMTTLALQPGTVDEQRSSVS
jgi:hypothetical protein